MRLGRVPTPWSNEMLQLRHDTPAAWTELAIAELDTFLQDHAANERKVSQSALQLAVQHPGRDRLVSEMIALAQEELDHFRRVFELLAARGKELAHDAPDPYMTRLRQAIKQADKQGYLLDRLLLFGIVEARGCERFYMLSHALEEPGLRAFYTELTQSEARHHASYLELARHYFDHDRVSRRLDALLDLEAQVAQSLPLLPKLH